MTEAGPSKKKQKAYHFHQEWETDYFFTSVKDKCVCLICGMSVAVGKKSNVERHFTTLHEKFDRDFPSGSSLRSAKVSELKVGLQRQQSLFTKPVKGAEAATEASFKLAHLLAKKKKPFTDGIFVKDAMTVVADSLFKDHKNGPEILSAISEVQLGVNTMARRVSALSDDAKRQLEHDIGTCKWFSIQCDESVDSSDTAQLAVFIRMVFEDFSVKEEFLTLLPLKTTTKGLDIYNVVKNYFAEKNVPLEKLVSITTDGCPAMTGRHNGFIANCKADPDFPRFLNYHCIIHQQSICAKVMGFDHVMTPVIKIINSIRAKAKQHRSFKLFLEELSSEYGDLLLHTEIRWLSRGKVLHRFLALLTEIKAFMEARNEDTTLLSETEWLLDLAFLADMTEKLNNLNCELQGKGKTISDMISAVKAFKAKLGLFLQQVKKRKMQHFPSVHKMLEENDAASGATDIQKYIDLLTRLGEEFENRFTDFVRLEPCATFISNPFMDVDISDISEQMGEVFSLSAVDLEMEILSLQNDIQLKSHKSAADFWKLVDAKKYPNISTGAMKCATLFGSTYLCESAFSDMNFIKSKFRTCLTDAHLDDCIRVNLSGYTPDYSALVDSMQCQKSH